MNEKTIERISVTATIEVDMDSSTATVSVKRVDEESISNDAHELQTVMMLVTGKALQEAVAEIAAGNHEKAIGEAGDVLAVMYRALNLDHLRNRRKEHDHAKP